MADGDFGLAEYVRILVGEPAGIGDRATTEDIGVGLPTRTDEEGDGTGVGEFE